MPASDLVNLPGLMDDAKCFALVRQHRWPEGVRCPGCASSSVIRDGCDDTQLHRQRYRCKACVSRFDDLAAALRHGGALPEATCHAALATFGGAGTAELVNLVGGCCLVSVVLNAYDLSVPGREEGLG